MLWVPAPPVRKTKKTINNNTTPIVSFIFEYIAQFWHAPAKNLGFWNWQFWWRQLFSCKFFQKLEKEHLCFVMDKQKFMQEERLQQRNLHTNNNKNNSTLKIEGSNSLIISETSKDQWCFLDTQTSLCWGTAAQKPPQHFKLGCDSLQKSEKRSACIV